MSKNYLDNKNKIESGFKIPDNYFTDFSERLLKQIPSEEPKVISFFQSHKNWILSCAAVLILALLIPVVSLFDKKSVEPNSAQLESYIINFSSISQQDIVDMLDENDSEKLQVDYKLDSISFENLDFDYSDLEQNL